VNLEVGDSFATYLGWTVPWGTPITLVGDTAGEVAEAQRQMLRIGIDRPAGAAEGGLTAWAAGGDIRSYRTATFADLADARSQGEVAVLDVRRDDEWAEGSIHGAVHIPLHDLERRMSEVPEGEVWVHCASGLRASIGASLLDRAGQTVVHVDDDWGAASKHEPLGVSGSH
jgi:rhodanese-related sulfurtransferase